MPEHSFIQKPGIWEGEGSMRLSIVEEDLKFKTKWSVKPAEKDGKIYCVQEVQIDGLAVTTLNHFCVRDVNGDRFVVDLETEALGQAEGKGVINPRSIAWELGLKELGFSGYEMYEKMDDDTYLMRAEFATSDQFRSDVTGTIRYKKEETKK